MRKIKFEGRNSKMKKKKKNARVVDHKNKLDGIMDILIEDEKISSSFFDNINIFNIINNYYN